MLSTLNSFGSFFGYLFLKQPYFSCKIVFEVVALYNYVRLKTFSAWFYSSTPMFLIDNHLLLLFQFTEFIHAYHLIAL